MFQPTVHGCSPTRSDSLTRRYTGTWKKYFKFHTIYTALLYMLIDKTALSYSLQMLQGMWIFWFPQSTTKPASASKHGCLLIRRVPKFKILLIIIPCRKCVMTERKQ
jgi:hypothetical protein